MVPREVCDDFDPSGSILLPLPLPGFLSCRFLYRVSLRRLACAFWVLFKVGTSSFDTTAIGSVEMVLWSFLWIFWDLLRHPTIHHLHRRWRVNEMGPRSHSGQTSYQMSN